MKVNSIFNPEGIVYTKKDGVLAFVFAFLMLIVSTIFLLIVYKTSVPRRIFFFLSSNYLVIRAFSLVYALLGLGLLYLFVKMEGRDLRSVGVTKKGIIRSLIIGIIGSLPFVFINFAGAGFSYTKDIQKTVVDLIYYIFCIGFFEEVIYRGYIQTRIEKFFKYRIVSVFVCGLIFCFNHLPYDLFRSISLMAEVVRLMIIMILHFIFVFLYRQSNNIIGSSIGHGLIDFIT